MVKATAMKPGPPKAKKTAPLKAKKTVTLKAKNNTSPKAKKSSAAKFLALNKTDDGRFRQKALQKRQTLQDTEVDGKRGVIALSNIPHGFFEGEMRRYFRQFGVLENIRLVRSKRTGQSCGYAYVEFQHYEVAKIVAKHMDGYLTFGKIMKCRVVPPAVVRDKLFKGKNIRPDNCPKLNIRKGAIRKLNKKRTEKQVNRRVARLKSTYSKKLKKLQELGIDLPLQTLLGTQQQSEGAVESQATNGHITPDASSSDVRDSNQASTILPEDASDIEPSEDINPDLTEEQKEELGAQREKLAAQIMSQLGSAKKVKTPKKSGAKTKSMASEEEKMVLEVDESDDEVVLKTPPNVVKKYVKMGAVSTLTGTSKNKNKNKTPRTVESTPKTVEITPKKVKTMPKETKTPKEAKGTPKTMKTPKEAKETPKEAKGTPKAMKTPKEAKGTPKAMKTPKETLVTPKSVKTPKEAKATPKVAKATPGMKKATPKVAKTTPGTKKVTPKATVMTPKAEEATPQIPEVAPEIAAPEPDTPKAEKKTPKATPKAEKTLKAKKMTPKTTDAMPKELTPGETQDTPKQKKKLSATVTQDTPRMEDTDPQNTPKTGNKTPKSKKQTPGIKNLSMENLQDTPASKKKTPKAKKMGVVIENGLPSGGEATPKKKSSTASPKGKKLSTLAKKLTPKVKKMTPKAIPQPDIKSEAIQLTPTPDKTVALTPQATPGKKKGKTNQTPVHTPKVTPGKRKKSNDVNFVTETTPSKKEKSNKATPGKTVTTPKTSEKTMTPKPMSGKKTDGKTPKMTPGKRKAALELVPDGKSHSKKQKVPMAS